MSFHQNNTGPGTGNAVPAPVLSKNKHRKKSSTLPSMATQQLIRTELEASHGTIFATYQSTPMVAMLQSSQQQQPASNKHKSVSDDFYVEEEVSQLTSIQAFDDAFLVSTSSRSASKRSTPVSQLSSMPALNMSQLTSMQADGNDFLVPTSSTSASKRSTPVLHLSGSDPALLTPIARSATATATATGVNMPRTNSNSNLSEDSTGTDPNDDIISCEDPNTDGIVDQFAPDFEAVHPDHIMTNLKLIKPEVLVRFGLKPFYKSYCSWDKLSVEQKNKALSFFRKLPEHLRGELSRVFFLFSLFLVRNMLVLCYL